MLGAEMDAEFEDPAREVARAEAAAAEVGAVLRREDGPVLDAVAAEVGQIVRRIAAGGVGGQWKGRAPRGVQQRSRIGVTDPNTGVAVFDSFGPAGQTGWLVFGGTSVAAPVVASIFALTGHSSATPQYPYANTTQFFDVVGGVNGTFPGGFLGTQNLSPYSISLTTTPVTTSTPPAAATPLIDVGTLPGGQLTFSTELRGPFQRLGL